jgi:tetratricopeptide (TPR) repeat protein
MIEQALALKRKFYGDVHPEVAVSLNDLAFLLHDRRDLDGAEAMYRQAVAIERQLLGDAHPSLGQALNNLAFVLRDKGDYDGARKAFFDSLAAYCGALGFEHPTLDGILDNAVRFHWEAIGKRRTEYGDTHPEVASALADLAVLYLATGRVQEAEPPAREAWEITLDFPEGEDEARKARVECVYGEVLSRTGEFDFAEELLSSGRERSLASQGGDPTQARAAIEHLIQLYEAWDRPREAREYRDQLAALAPQQ